MNDDFSVGVGMKTMTLLFELAAELAEIVDLSVEDDPRRTIFVKHRLVSARQVDNAQAAHAEACPILYKHSFRVRSSVDKRLAHPVNDTIVNPGVIACADDSCNATHIVSS